MQQISNHSLLVIALVASGACADLPDDEAMSESSSVVGVRVVSAIAGIASGDASIVPTAPTGPNMLRYFGGKLIARPRIYAIRWNSNVDARVLPKVSAFYRAVFDGEYEQWLTEYNTEGVVPVDGGASSNQRF